MAENNEPLDNPLNSESNAEPEKADELISPSSGQESITQNQETENMEVHHHPDLHHRKKHWKEYFLEFLMIFLAVTLSFFAESYREYIVEKKHENDFIQSYIEDLKTDTAAINQNIAFRKTKIIMMDSLMLLLSSQQIKGHENDLYYFGRTLIRNVRFQSNDRTITQLKSSGSLRLIRNEQAADSMILYQKLVDVLTINQEDERNERANAGPILSRMFNPFEFDKMISIEGVNRPINSPALRSYDQNIQLDLAYYIHQIKGSTFIIESRLELLYDKAKNILAFLKRKYHFE